MFPSLRTFHRVRHGMTRKVNIEKLSVWVLEFTAYSFIGWVYETILTSAVRGHFADTAGCTCLSHIRLLHNGIGADFG